MTDQNMLVNSMQPISFLIHSKSIFYWKILLLMLSVTSMKSKMAMAQDSGCLYVIPMPPKLPNFMEFVVNHQDNKVASLKEGGARDNTLTRAIERIMLDCDCNATAENVQKVNLVRECPKTFSKSWVLDYSHCRKPTTTLATTSTRTTLVTTPSVETTLTTSPYVTNSSLPGIGEVHTANADHSSIIIAATVVPLILLIAMAAFIIYKCKTRGWCTGFSFKPGKRCYQARDPAPPPSQVGQDGKLPTPFPNQGSDNLGLEPESPVSIIPMENRFSTFGRPKSQAVSEYSASTSFEEQNPDYVPIRNGLNNNRKPRSLYLDLSSPRPSEEDIPYMDQCPSPGPTPTSPAAGFNAGFLRGISRVELI